MVTIRLQNDEGSVTFITTQGKVNTALISKKNELARFLHPKVVLSLSE